MNLADAEKMKLRVVLFDETKHWDDAIKDRAGRIFAAYLLDASKQVHCAEITPSYDLTYLYSTTLNGRNDDDLQDVILRDGAGEGGKYVHCSVIDAMPASRVYQRDGLPFEQVDLEDETYESLFEKCVEHYRCNVPIDIPLSEGLVAWNDGAGDGPDVDEDSSRPTRSFRP